MLDRNGYTVTDLSPGDSAPASGLTTITLNEFVTLELPVREQVLSPILPVRGLAMLYAARGIGKTYVAMGIAYAASCGSEFLQWKAPAPRRVLYVDGEMPAEMLQERAQRMMAASECKPLSDDHFVLLSMDRQALGTSINLANREHQAAVEAKIGRSELVVLDNLSTLVNGGRENDAESWDEMQRWLLQLRRRGLTVLLVHHSGRGENARGTSKREDVLDTVIQLKRPHDYDVDEGARFEVHLTKARGIYGDQALPFEAKLTVVEGRDLWTCNIIKDRDLEEVLKFSTEGLSVRDIADEMGLSKSKVNRLQTKLRAEGRLVPPTVPVSHAYRSGTVGQHADDTKLPGLVTEEVGELWRFPEWTPRLVAACLADALAKLHRLAGPETLFPLVGRRPAILQWLEWLSPDERQLAWDRANGRPWKAIAHAHGVDRTTAWRRWTCAMVAIAARLNAANDATTLQHRQPISREIVSVD